ncbi:MAG: TonB family protein [Gammaproteobacteria bacterium]|nr:TonB family protein [Gammaproteobacteria bacterium]
MIRTLIRAVAVSGAWLRAGGMTVICLAWGLAACSGQPYGRSAPPALESGADTCPTVAGPTAEDFDYGRRVLDAVKRHAFYPELARYLGESGEVDLCLKVGDQGGSVAALVDRSSGFALLDGAALYAVGRAAVDTGIPPPPKSLSASAGWIKLPIRFSLEGETKPMAPRLPAGDAVRQRAFVQQFASVAAGQDGVVRETSASQACRLGNSDSWQAAVNHEVVARLHDPQGPVPAGMRGTVLLGVEFDRSGRLLRTAILKSSGQPVFDGVALMALASTFAGHQLPPLKSLDCPPSASFLTSVSVILTDNF